MGRKNIMNISTARIVSYNKHHNKTYSGNAMSQRLVDAKWQNDIVEEDDGEDDDDDDDDDDIYIMMSVCLFVCNEKWALPPGSLL